MRAGARMRAGSWIRAAGLPYMRPVHLLRAAERPPRPSRRGAPSSHPKRVGAAHLRGGAGEAPQVPADAPRGSPVRLAATRRSNIGAHPFLKAAQQLGGHHTASDPPFQVSGPICDACAQQRRRRRGARSPCLAGLPVATDAVGGCTRSGPATLHGKNRARWQVRASMRRCWVAPAAGCLRARRASMLRGCPSQSGYAAVANWAATLPPGILRHYLPRGKAPRPPAQVTFWPDARLTPSRRGWAAGGQLD